MGSISKWHKGPKMPPVKSFYIYYFIPIKLFSVVFRTKKLGLESPYELWCNDQITDMDQKIKYWTLMQLQLNVNTVHAWLSYFGWFVYNKNWLPLLRLSILSDIKNNSSNESSISTNSYNTTRVSVPNFHPLLY